MKRSREGFLVWLLVVVISIFFHREYLNEFPRFIHAWTQSDRYALSIGFVKNGFNLFKPTSLNLSPDPEFTPETETGITPVDLPLGEFIVACAMKISGTTEPIIFRLFTILIASAGMTWLYLIFLRLSQNRLVAAMPVLFMFLCPVYFYYSSGFLPTITSLSLVLGGVYFLFSGDQQLEQRSFILFTLAALLRMPFIFPLISIGFVYFRNKRKLIYPILGIIAVIVYALWNRYLASIHGSLFLRKFLHAGSLEESLSMLSETWSNWNTSWFSIWHYIAAGVSILVYLLYKLWPSIFSSLPEHHSKQRIPSEKGLRLFSCFWILMSIAYYFLMQEQFIQHDYYFLDSFFLPLILLFSLLLKNLASGKKSLQIITSLFLLFLPVASFSNYQVQKERRTAGAWNRYEITYHNFKNSKHLLDSLRIPADSRMLVIDAYSVNAPLILMDRKGYTLLSTNEQTIPDALKRNFDYVVIQDEFLLSDIIRFYPKLKSELKKLGGDGRISVYERNNKIPDTEPDFASFFKLTNEKGSETIPECKVGSEIEFGCTVEIPDAFLRNGTQHYLIIKSRISPISEINDSYLVCDVSRGEEHLFYRSFSLKDYTEKSGKEQTVEFLFVIPGTINAEKIKIYVWNPGKKDNIVFTDFHTSWYE